MPVDNQAVLVGVVMLTCSKEAFCQVASRKSGRQADAICSMWRWSVPQQPPMTLRWRSCCFRSFAYCWASSAGLPASRSGASFSSAWLMCEAFARRPRMRAVHGRIADRLARAGLPLYAQHVDPIDTGTLTDIFRDDPRASTGMFSCWAASAMPTASSA